MEAFEIIERLVLNFRWKYQGYGRLSCSKCGALAEEEFINGQMVIRRIDVCSMSCVWRVAELWLDDNRPTPD